MTIYIKGVILADDPLKVVEQLRTVDKCNATTIRSYTIEVEFQFQTEEQINKLDSVLNSLYNNQLLRIVQWEIKAAVNHYIHPASLYDANINLYKATQHLYNQNE